ncbi:MAG: PPOX class F420-dependent oxidoreductase [Ktedonobacteraceae bacterium]|nr:PPOX class F420-dependent oxidoreductase [Ktedonobacteraceae bacterium]
MLEKRQLATIMPDGTPQVMPVWVDFDGTHVLINTSKGRRKTLNMEKQPRVGLDIVDNENPFHWLSVRGHVAEITEHGADDHIDKMAKKYLGVDTYPNRQPDDIRIICKIVPDRVIAQ